VHSGLGHMGFKSLGTQAPGFGGRLCCNSASLWSYESWYELLLTMGHNDRAVTWQDVTRRADLGTYRA
jgi:hypothetical protein